MKIKEREVDRAYDAIDRHIAMRILFDVLITEEEIAKDRDAMLLGLYSAFDVVADNWDDVCQWFDKNESSRGYTSPTNDVLIPRG